MAAGGAARIRPRCSIRHRNFNSVTTARHDVVDALLNVRAARARCLRETMSLPLGGDEFMVLLESVKGDSTRGNRA